MRLELTKGKVTHWYELALAKKKFHKRWGYTGGKEQKQAKTYPTAGKAQLAHDALLAKLTAEGYRDKFDPGTAPAKDTPRNPTLEAAIRANREDPGPYQVYADWLQQQGSPLGELIVLAQANKKKQADKIIGGLGLPATSVATYGWRHGMLQWVRFENEDWTNNNFDPGVVARNVFAQPACAALEEIRIGVLRWDFNNVDVPAVLAEARPHAWARDLVRLHLGDVDRNIDMAHHMIGDVGKPISKTFPGLRTLVLHSSAQTWRGGKETFGLSGLDLPELRELVIETCSMSKARLAHVLAAKLPKLEKLELWFGSENYDCDANVKGLTKLLAGAVFPKLRHLGLCNAEFQNDIAVAVSVSKVAAQLESLDLSMGTMTETGADALIARAKSFPKLKALKLDKNFLAPATIRAVKKAFPFATAADQKQPDDSIEGETHYYVSVAE